MSYGWNESTQDQPKSTVPRSFALFLAKGRESTTLNMPVHPERSAAESKDLRLRVFYSYLSPRVRIYSNALYQGMTSVVPQKAKNDDGF